MMKRRCSQWGFFALLTVCLGLSAPGSALGEEIVLANLHYVSPEDTFTGIDVSFIALQDLAGITCPVRVEAYRGYADGVGLSFELLDSWTLDLRSTDITPAGSMGFYLPRFPLIMTSLEAHEPEPYATSIFATVVVLQREDLEQGRIFPNLRAAEGEAGASLFDFGNGDFTSGLMLHHLTDIIVPPEERAATGGTVVPTAAGSTPGPTATAPSDGDGQVMEAVSAGLQNLGSGAGAGAADGLETVFGYGGGAGTHVIIQAQPRMQAP